MKRRLSGLFLAALVLALALNWTYLDARAKRHSKSSSDKTKDEESLKQLTEAVSNASKAPAIAKPNWLGGIFWEACEPSKGCTREYEPVCGTDGITYSNECTLKQKECQTNGMVAKAYDGVCDEDNAITKCAAKIRKLTGFAPIKDCPHSRKGMNYVCPTRRNKGKVREKGEGRSKAMTCPFIRCELGECQWARCNKTIEYKKGPWLPAQSCISVSCQPGYACVIVSGQARCVFGARKRPMQSQCAEHCKPGQECVGLWYDHFKCMCRTDCNNDLMPVCGSDGHTYLNQCWLESYSCNVGYSIKFVSSGECKPKPTGCNVICRPGRECKTIDGSSKCVCIKDCPSTIKKVCSSEGRTFDNECIMHRWACQRGKTVAVEYEGECVDDDDDDNSTTTTKAPKRGSPKSGKSKSKYKDD